jgi:hypothetical protein
LATYTDGKGDSHTEYELDFVDDWTQKHGQIYTAEQIKQVEDKANKEFSDLVEGEYSDEYVEVARKEQRGKLEALLDKLRASGKGAYDLDTRQGKIDFQNAILNPPRDPDEIAADLQPIDSSKLDSRSDRIAAINRRTKAVFERSATLEREGLDPETGEPQEDAAPGPTTRNETIAHINDLMLANTTPAEQGAPVSTNPNLPALADWLDEKNAQYLDKVRRSEIPFLAFTALALRYDACRDWGASGYRNIENLEAFAPGAAADAVAQRYASRPAERFAIAETLLPSPARFTETP